MFCQQLTLGRVGANPEVRYTQGGQPVANFSMASDTVYKDSAGQTQKTTEWHRMVAFGKLAEVIQEFVKKGDPLFVIGKPRTRKWEDRDGVTRYAHEVVVQQLKLLPRKENGNGATVAEAEIPEAPGGGTEDKIPF